jgi:hypothetical protein
MQRNAGRSGGRDVLLVIVALLAVSLSSAASALAAPPSNDDRANAQQITLGQRVDGSTVDATANDVDDSSGCGPSDTPSVWYRLDATRDGRAIASLQANGDLDVVLDVYQRVRSQFNAITCDTSDRQGRASTEFRIKRGESYLVRVSQQAQSVSGTFSLTVDLGQPPATPPGRALPRGGANGSVQRVFEPSNAWSARLREGRTYRVNLAPESCMRLSIYGPGTSSFDESPVRILRCGGYAQFTPGPHEGGRYSFLVEPASRLRSSQSYHLEVARAGADDAVPGRFVRNYQRVRGSLNANRVDVVDLYRFDVVRRSITDLLLTTGDAEFDLVLLSAGGRRIERSPSGDGRIHVRTEPGRYFVEVRAHRHASGSYRLTRGSKTITHTSLSATPRRSGPGSSVNLGVNVAPNASGRVTIVVERFDPTSGWQFLRRFEQRVSGGSTSVAFRPPSVGRYRAKATFNGTRIAAGSSSARRSFRVEAPLTE